MIDMWAKANKDYTFNGGILKGGRTFRYDVHIHKDMPYKVTKDSNYTTKYYIEIKDTIMQASSSSRMRHFKLVKQIIIPPVWYKLLNSIKPKI